MRFLYVSTDAEKKNKMSILVKANALHEKAKHKSKEVYVIAYDIEAAGKNGRICNCSFMCL